MQYTSTYQSFLGKILLAADESGLTGLWLEGAKFYTLGLAPEHLGKELPVFREVKKWLDIYFSGKEPDFMPPLHLVGSSFQIDVWNILREIPYGKTITYGAIAQRMAKHRGLAKMSAQAVGGAVGHNPISIIVPCHRVVGTQGSLTGYAGGIARKEKLLKLEGINTEVFTIPTKGTAL